MNRTTRGGALPTREAPRGTGPLARLFEAAREPASDERGGLSGELLRRYDGDLRIPLRPDRPAVVANFVETLDGVVAMGSNGTTGGGEVSGFSPTDRFVMGLLRALADAVLVGASTIRSSPRAAWTPEGVFPDARAGYVALRRELGLAPAPTTIVATASGDLHPALPVFQEDSAPIVIAAPAKAVAELERLGFGSNVSIRPIAGQGDETITGLVDLAGQMGARLLLSEAGPRLFAGMAGAGLVDEVFVTVAPQLAGRAEGAGRLGMVEGVALWPGHPSWARLLSVRHADDHLFLRYRFEGLAGEVERAPGSTGSGPQRR